MKHGNILTLFNASETTIQEVEAIIRANSTNYKRLGDIFYIATPDIFTARSIVSALDSLPIEFLFYYNNISTGSAVLGNNGNPNLMAIKQILV